MTVVFFHGLAGSRATYAWLPDAIEGHAVVRPDFRGHGEAPRTPGAYRISDYVGDALEVLRATGPAFVVGHSLGGVAAWWAAQRAPELVLGALLEDPPLFTIESTLAVEEFRRLRALAGGDEALIAVALALEPAGLTADALAARAYALAHLDPAALDPVLDGTLLEPIDTVAAVPTRILAAGVGPAFGVEHERRLAVPVTRVAGAGHSIHDEQAHRPAYLDAVTALLDGR